MNIHPPDDRRGTNGRESEETRPASEARPATSSGPTRPATPLPPEDRGQAMEPIDTSYLYVKREGSPLAPVEPAPAWQSVWFQTRKRPWRSLAVVPVDDQAALDAAKALQGVGRLAEGNQLTVVDATGLPLDGARDLLAALGGPASGGGRIIAVDSPRRTPSAIPLARTADAAVLLVNLGRTTLAQARRVMELVGPERFVGCVVTPKRRRRRRRELRS